MFNGRGDHISVLSLFIPYFLSVFFSFFSLQLFRNFLMLSFPFVCYSVRMVMKMIVNIENVGIHNGFVRSGTILHFALPLFFHYSITFSIDDFLLAFHTCTCSAYNMVLYWRGYQTQHVK
jgi:hypothetical protein